ncbi:hypothetical protein [Glycomyces xiaoerkulensis]|uniref:hypothetical protein n=1 Tax=Glycomyces xiaoerkulensis TaxID=2038139 RepID=UPI000C257179|nr:hypothetical protein [Glycomyces xiaoerkulensis]
MDEFDQFPTGDDPGDEGGPFDDAAFGDTPEPSSEFDALDGLDDPDQTGLDEFALTDTDDTDAGEFNTDLDDRLDLGAEPDQPAPETDETAYGATYEQTLVDQADNPPAFPPELDLDAPEPIDGYPWVDLDVLGTTETEPWVNPEADSMFTETDLDDPAAGALARFWQQ